MKNFTKLFFVILLTTTTSCEVDDICVESTTPNLIIKFYSATDTDEIKTTTNLEASAIGKSAVYENVAVDSILIPLDINNTLTTYKIGIENDNEKVDTLKINYQLKDIFVSRSCGYKTTFLDVTINTTNHWIKDLKLNNISINDEKEAHIYIYY